MLFNVGTKATICVGRKFRCQLSQIGREEEVNLINNSFEAAGDEMRNS